MLIYLAVPYTHRDPVVRRSRFERVTTLAGRMMQQGLHVYSPITHGHPIAERVDLPHDWQFWRDHCIKTLDACGQLHVYMLDGWKESVGVQAEIAHAETKGIPIVYIEGEY